MPPRTRQALQTPASCRIRFFFKCLRIAVKTKNKHARQEYAYF